MQEGSVISERYRLLKKVGRGSFGEVWLACDMQTGMDVAVKIYVSMDDSGIKDFKNEYSETYSLNHPNLLHASYFDTFESRPYLVMSYCPGSATNLIGCSDEDEIWRFIRDTAAGLEYLHQKDIVHRDIKPDNILIDTEGNYLITDFGISVKMKTTMLRNTKNADGTGDVAGTVAYMGPELFSSRPTSVKATDIWALGSALYEILTGDLPFIGQGGMMQKNGADIPEISGKWSKNLKALVRSCLSKETWDRPSATVIKEFAQSVLDGGKVTWKMHAKKTVSPLWIALSVVVIVIAGVTGHYLSADQKQEPALVADTMVVKLPDHVKYSKGGTIAEMEYGDTSLTVRYGGNGLYSTGVSCLTESLEVETSDIAVKYNNSLLAFKESIPSEVAFCLMSKDRRRVYRFIVSVDEEKKASKPAVQKEEFVEVHTQPAKSRKSDKVCSANNVSFKMIFVQGGTFNMGATSEVSVGADANELPVHSVTVDSYYIGETEVTQQLWEAVMGANPSSFKGPSRPVEKVSWNDCITFISKLNAVTGLKFRLPTEAEWEYAAKGGEKSKEYKYSGGNDISSVAWYNANSGETTHKAKSKSANELGIYDMSGNVWEWVNDCFTKYQSAPEFNPRGSNKGDLRVYRGGCYVTNASSCRVSRRIAEEPDSGFDFTGLRLAL